jgi:TPR repeat protein
VAGSHTDVAFDQVAHWEAMFALHNPKEECNKDKAHGTNAEIDDALDYIHRTNGRRVDFKAAEKLLVSAGEKGYAKAFDLLCSLLRLRKITPTSDFAVRSFIKSAVRGSPDGQYCLAMEYFNLKNYQAASYWFDMASQQGHINSLEFLAIMVENGFHLQKDPRAATELYQRAAEAGHPRAQLQLGSFYHEGTGTLKQSFRSAAEWFTKVVEMPPSPTFEATRDITKVLDAAQVGAREQWRITAHANLGFMHLDAEHFPQNTIKAIPHLTIGAEGGNVDCQAQLGEVFDTSFTGPRALPVDMRNDVTAIKWYTMAARQNDHESQLHIGEHYQMGAGVKQDIRMAGSGMVAQSSFQWVNQSGSRSWPPPLRCRLPPPRPPR